MPYYSTNLGRSQDGNFSLPLIPYLNKGPYIIVIVSIIIDIFPPIYNDEFKLGIDYFFVGQVSDFCSFTGGLCDAQQKTPPKRGLLCAGLSGGLKRVV